MATKLFRIKDGYPVAVGHPVDVRELLQTGLWTLKDPSETETEEAPVVKEEKKEEEKTKGVDSLPPEPVKEPEKKTGPAIIPDPIKTGSKDSKAKR